MRPNHDPLALSSGRWYGNRRRVWSHFSHFATMSSTLHAQFLGGYRLRTASGQELTPPATHNARLLLAYLLLHPRRHHARAFLAGLLWPDLPESTARKRLNQALWRVRQTWDGFVSSKESITIREDASFQLDVAIFQEVLDAAWEAVEDEKGVLLRKGLSYYAGPLLPGYYEDWVLLLREQLHQRYLLALEECIEVEMQAGAYAQALVWAQRLVQAEPLDENAQRQLIQLYGLLGQREQALQQYEALCRLLAEEVNTVPSLATQKLVAQLRAASTVPPSTPADNAPLFTQDHLLPLVGREQAWQQVQIALSALEQHRGGTVTVRGEPGIGKSRFLAEIMAQAQWRNLQVWQAAAPESGRHSPYAIWIELLRPRLSTLQVQQWALNLDPVWLATLADLLPELHEWLPTLPELPTLPAVEAQQRLQEAILRLLSISTQPSPLLLLLDDLQWADIASLETLNHLLVLCQQSPILFILSYRDDDPAVLRRLKNTLDAASPPPRQIQLQPLPAEATGQLIRAALGLPHATPRFEKRLYQATSGHPLFLLETLRALYDQGILFRNSSGRWSTPWDESTEDYTELPLTERLQEILLRRLEHLTPAAQTLFETAAVLNRPFRVDLMKQLSDLSAPVTMAAIQELHQQRLLRSDGTRFRVTHDLLRQTVYDTMDAEVRQQLHARIAAALQDDPDIPPEVLAMHFHEAGDWRPALVAHRRAAERAEALSSYAAALSHWHTCIELAERLDLDAEDRFDLLAARERVLDVLGQRDAQAVDIAAMMELAADDSLRRSQALRRQAYLYNHLSRYAEAAEAAQQALELARSLQAPDEEQAALLAWSQVLNWWGKLEEAIQPLQEALQLTESSTSADIRGRTHQAMADALIGLGRHDEAIPHLHTALDLFRQTANRRGEADVLHLLAIIATEQGRLSDAHELYKAGLQISQEIGFLYGEGRILLNVGNLYYLEEGKYYRALQQYDASREIFASLQNQRGLALARLNRVSLRCDLFGARSEDFADVEHTLQYARKVNDNITVGQCYSMMGVCHASLGRYAEAMRWLQEAARVLTETGQLWMGAQDYRELARIQLLLHKTEEATASLDQAVTLLKSVGAQETNPIILSLRARIALQKQDLPQALRFSQQAIADLTTEQEQAPQIYFQHAQILKAAGRADEAQQAITQAHAALEHLLQDFPPELQRESLQHKREFRRIMEAFAEQMTIVEVKLPAADAPIGRPLQEHEWRSVRWTVHHPGDNQVRGKIALRRHRLLRLLEEAIAQEALPRIEDLAQTLQVSPKTIKRDLAALRADGHPVRTRGSR